MRTSSKTSKRKRATAVDSAAEVAKPEAAAAEPTVAAPMVVLPSVCTVKDAAGLKESLCKVADEAAGVTLDIRSVERVDTAVVQLLYAFVRDRGERSLAVAWLGASPALLDAASLLGVHSLLRLPEKESIGAAA